jgi:hypothetical protein
MLVIICQMGIPVMPNLNITSTGAEKGKILKTTQMGLFGTNKSRLKNQSGTMANMVYIALNPCPSLMVPLIDAIQDESTANNR